MPRTVVIGGVGPTTGASLARRFAEEGDQVALWARSNGFTDRLAEDLRAETAGDVGAVQVDVTDPEAVRDGVSAVNDLFGTVDVYVHNTPAPGWSGPLDSDPEELATTLDTVCYGFTLVVDELLADLREDGGTVILNTGDFARWIAREMAAQLAPEGVHVAHVFIDGRVNSESIPDEIPDEKRADPDVLAEEFLHLVEQDRDAWSFDVDFRPWGDDAFRTWR
ncbi:MAG: short-chain dehydrogenase [halophilic archaeon J07HX64]|jgi:Short-chain dehydrogenases of various substrate specificities|nr:MAG: short-chain dehydrogenase [halophilic archaeon J07HX64]